MGVLKVHDLAPEAATIRTARQREATRDGEAGSLAGGRSRSASVIVAPTYLATLCEFGSRPAPASSSCEVAIVGCYLLSTYCLYWLLWL